MSILILLIVLYAYIFITRSKKFGDFVYYDLLKIKPREYKYTVTQKDITFKKWTNEIRKLLSFKPKRKWRGYNLKYKLRLLLEELGEKREWPLRLKYKMIYRYFEIFPLNMVHENPQQKLLRTRNAKTNMQERTFKRYGWRRFQLYIQNATWWIRNHAPPYWKGVEKKPYRDRPLDARKIYNKFVRNYTKNRHWIERKAQLRFSPILRLYGRDFLEEYLKNEKEKTQLKKMEEDLKTKKNTANVKADFLEMIIPLFNWRAWSKKDYHELELAYNKKKKKVRETERNYPKNL
jgi:hypothetical protein